MNRNAPQKPASFTSTNPQATIDFGSTLAANIKGGDIITLTGPLGSGKTHLVKGIARGLQTASTEKVSSPTFVLINEYRSTESTLSLYHIDAYRIETIQEFEMLGFDDLCNPDSVVIIEWADKVSPVLATIQTIDIQLSHVNPTTRQININWP
jgi:tRNA threonylcarbamoyladenosine biosynthesis protein TsaE